MASCMRILNSSNLTNFYALYNKIPIDTNGPNIKVLIPHEIRYLIDFLPSPDNARILGYILYGLSDSTVASSRYIHSGHIIFPGLGYGGYQYTQIIRNRYLVLTRLIYQLEASSYKVACELSSP